MQAITLDQAGMALVERHRRWWRREETLVTRVEGEPLAALVTACGRGRCYR